MTTTSQIPDPTARPTSMTRIAIPSTLAAALEYFDFFIFTTASALVFGELFFPAFGGAGGSLASFATLFVGFAARPLGGVLCGHLGDRWGRKPVLVMSTTVMGVGTTLIGVLPSYAVIGVAAPILLIVLRVIQGLALGGLWGGAALLCIEHCDPRKRGFYGSLQGFGNGIGALIANAIFLSMAATLSRADLLAWGWRVAFLAGLPMIGIGWYIHRVVEETPVFRELQARSEVGAAARVGIGVALREQKRQILLAAGAFVLANGSYYIMASGLLDYGTRVLGMASSTMLGLILGSMATQLITVPLFGALSDRFGRRKLFLIGAVGMAVWAYPLFLLVETRSIPLILVALVVGLTLHAMLYGPQSALFAEMFVARARFAGASVGYQLGSVFGGGLAPFIMTGLLILTRTTASVAVYIVVLAVITGGCVLAIRDTAGRDLGV